MSLNATLRSWFDEFTQATGEEILHVQMYTENEETYNYKAGINDWDEMPAKIWSVAPYLATFSFHALPDEVLDYEFDPGYGSADAPPVIAWSNNYVLYIEEYDGSECLRWIPRFPFMLMPKESWDTLPVS